MHGELGIFCPLIGEAELEDHKQVRWRAHSECRSHVADVWKTHDSPLLGVRQALLKVVRYLPL